MLRLRRIVRALGGAFHGLYYPAFLFGTLRMVGVSVSQPVGLAAFGVAMLIGGRVRWTRERELEPWTRADLRDGTDVREVAFAGLLIALPTVAMSWPWVLLSLAVDLVLVVGVVVWIRRSVAADSLAAV